MAGTSGPATRIIGASRYSNALSATIAATSPPMPTAFVSSWTIRTLPVLRAVSRMASESSGLSVLRSSTSTLTPSSSRSRAASRHRCSISPYVMTLMSSPSAFTSADPIGSVYSPSGTSPLTRRYVRLCSRKTTGSSSRTALLSNPLVSYGVDGATTLSPGVCAKYASGL